MTAYKNGERKNDTMKAMIAPVTDANLDNIALFYALQKPARAQTPAAGDAAAGQALSTPCAACHGAEGVSGNPSSPSLAGQDAQYLAAALHGYKDGTRGNTTMKALAAALDDTAIKNLAAFYAGLQPQPPNVRKPLSAAAMGGAMRPLPRRQRQQHRSAHPRPGRPARGISAEGAGCLSDGRAPQPGDGGDGRGAVRERCQEPRGILRAPEGAGRRLRADTAPVGRPTIATIAERSRTMNRMLLTALIVGSVGLAGTAQAAGDAAAGKAKATACAHVPRAQWRGNPDGSQAGRRGSRQVHPGDERLQVGQARQRHDEEVRPARSAPTISRISLPTMRR